MKDAIRSFGSALKTKGGVGLLFYAGHGVQSHGENYLLPLGELPSSEDALRTGAITRRRRSMPCRRRATPSTSSSSTPAATIRFRTPAARRAGCRASTRSSSLFVSFSTSPGEVALDGAGRNSPYAKHLQDAIGTANLTLEDTFKRTLKGVYQETGGQQQPWMSSSFFGEFVFRPSAASGLTAAPAMPHCAAAGRARRPSRMAPGAALAGPMPALGGLYLVGRQQSERQPLPRHGALTPSGNHEPCGTPAAVRKSFRRRGDNEECVMAYDLIVIGTGPGGYVCAIRAAQLGHEGRGGREARDPRRHLPQRRLHPVEGAAARLRDVRGGRPLASPRWASASARRSSISPR